MKMTRCLLCINYIFFCRRYGMATLALEALDNSDVSHTVVLARLLATLAVGPDNAEAVAAARHGALAAVAPMIRPTAPAEVREPATLLAARLSACTRLQLLLAR